MYLSFSLIVYIVYCQLCRCPRPPHSSLHLPTLRRTPIWSIVRTLHTVLTATECTAGPRPTRIMVSTDGRRKKAAGALLLRVLLCTLCRPQRPRGRVLVMYVPSLKQATDHSAAIKQIVSFRHTSASALTHDVDHLQCLSR
jgi:hypothetical protein